MKIFPYKIKLEGPINSCLLDYCNTESHEYGHGHRTRPLFHINVEYWRKEEKKCVEITDQKKNPQKTDQNGPATCNPHSKLSKSNFYTTSSYIVHFCYSIDFCNPNLFIYKWSIREWCCYNTEIALVHTWFFPEN